MEGSGIESIPEGCIAHAISLTSPRDACRLSAVSSAFYSAAVSDTVWGRFLPADYQSLLSSAALPIDFSSTPSKRDIFFRLCDSILLDDGKMSVWLEKSSGQKCFMLSARALCIIWGDTPQYWTWIPISDSRFSEAAELIDVCWLEIRGKIQSTMLNRKTTYAAFLVFKLADWSRGLGDPLQEASVAVGSQSSTKAVCLQPNMTRSRRAPWPRVRFFPIRNFNRRAVVQAAPANLGEGGGTDSEAAQHEALAAVTVVGGGTDVGAASHEALAAVTGGGGGTDGGAASHEAFAAVTGGSGGTDSGAASPLPRNDGWMEILMGEFYNDEGEDGEVLMSFTEVKGGHWKKGLIVLGIEIRPKT